MNNLFVGTSGWTYPWENFYEGISSSKEKLVEYAKHFNTTEVNYSFYHLPKSSTYENWNKQSPDDFLFSVKLSRFISHIKRLHDIKEPLKKFFQNASVLGKKLGPILVQLPPNFKIDNDRLEEFLQEAEEAKQELDMRSVWFAFEFRHESWFENNVKRTEALDILKEHNAAFVFGHSGRYPYPSDEPITADFVYLRFHGPKGLFSSEYGSSGLQPWFEKVRMWLEKRIKVYGYFNNTMSEYAVNDAKLLINNVGL